MFQTCIFNQPHIPEMQFALEKNAFAPFDFKFTSLCFYELCMGKDWIPLFYLKIFERILFIWAIRHPASGYVQGINDLVTPFFVVYVFEYIGKRLVLRFVCDGLPMWQFAFFFIARVASNRAFLHLARLRGRGVHDNKFQRMDPETPWDCVVFRLDSHCPFVPTLVSSVCRPSFQSDLDPSHSFCV